MLHVPPAEAYAVEDSYNGIRSAHSAGLHPVMIPDLLPSTPEMEQLQVQQEQYMGYMICQEEHGKEQHQ